MASSLVMQDSRFGFCCKYIPEDGSTQAARAMNTSTVTMAYLGRLDPKAAYDKLSAVVAHNLKAFRLQIAHVVSRPKLERLHRLSSDLLPGYTHPACREFYRDPDLRRLIEAELAAMGQLARDGGVPHPGVDRVDAALDEPGLDHATDHAGAGRGADQQPRSQLAHRRLAAGLVQLDEHVVPVERQPVPVDEIAIKPTSEREVRAQEALPQGKSHRARAVASRHAARVPVVRAAG